MSNKTQSDVVSQVSEFIGRYLQCSEHQRTVLALWVVHTYCFPAAQVTPYLSIRSAHKQSGKTLCLQLLALLCEGSALTSGGFKASDLALPMPAKPISALLLDECHATIGTRSRSKGPTLRGLLAGSFHLLHGHGNIAQERNAFCPKAFAGFGPLPEDLADRSIPIILEPLKGSGVQQPWSFNNPMPGLAASSQQLEASNSEIQNLKSEIPERFDLRHAIDQVQPIRNRLNHWADVHLLPLLHKLSPLPRSAFPPNLSPRQQDIVEPLLQIAGLLGGPWPRRALQAFAIIFNLQTRFDLLPNLHVLADVRNCFAHHSYPERLSTAGLLDWLHSLPARPWVTEHDADRPLTAYKLARLLMPFNIRPRYQRMPSGKKNTTGPQPPGSPARGGFSRGGVEPPGSPARADFARDGAEPPGSSPARGYQLEDFQKAWKEHLGFHLAQAEAGDQKPEITNKIAVCSTVSLDADLAVSPAADNPKSKIKNLKSRITCSPECELRVGSGKLKAQDSGSANLPMQQLRQRMEALMRELSPLFSQPVPLRSSSRRKRSELSQKLEAPQSKIINENAGCSTVSLAQARVAQPPGPPARGGFSRAGVEVPSAVSVPSVAQLAASGQQLAASSSHIKNQQSEESLGRHNGTPDQRCGDVLDDRFQVAFGLKR